MAAGDSGGEGPFYSSNGASGDKVIGVAAVGGPSTVVPTFNVTYTLHGSKTTAVTRYIPYLDPLPWTLDGAEVIPISVDACEPLSADFSNYTDTTFVVVPLGACDTQTQQNNLLAAGANFIMFILPADGNMDYINVAGGWYIDLLSEDAETMNKTYLAGGRISLELAPSIKLRFGVSWTVFKPDFLTMITLETATPGVL